MGIDSSSGNRSSNDGGSSIIGSSLGSKVFSTTGSYSRLISRNHSSVRVSNQVCVQVERAIVTIASSIGVSRGSNCQRSSSQRSSNSYRGNWSSSSVGSSLNSKVISTGSCNSRLISRYHSSVRVSNQVSVQVERSVVTITSSIGVSRGSNSQRNSGSKRS